MNEVLLKKYGISVTKTVTLYGTFYHIKDDVDTINISTTNELEAYNTALLLALSKMAADNHQLLKALISHAFPD